VANSRTALRRFISMVRDCAGRNHSNEQIQ
jgi:hypothetical protein